MGETNGNVQIVAKVEIVLLSNGQMMFKKQVPTRFMFNGMMESAKQEGLAQFFQEEQQKVVAPSADAAHRLKL